MAEQHLILALMDPNAESTQNLARLFSGSPLAFAVESVVVYMTAPTEVSTLNDRKSELIVRSVFSDSAIMYNPNTKVTELDVYLDMSGINRQELFEIQPDTYDKDFRPYACLVVDPMRSLPYRQHSKAVMASLTHYPVVVQTQKAPVSSEVAKFWLERFNPEAKTQHPHL